MPILTQCKHESPLIEQEAGVVKTVTHDCEILSEESKRLWLRIFSLSESRRHRIITIQQQIAEGRYECDEKIDMILDKLLKKV